MAFIRKIKRGDYTYLQKVKTIRIAGKVYQKHLAYIGREINDKKVISCSISDCKVESVKLSGPLLVLHHIAKSIGLPKFLGDYSNEILSMVYAHCLDVQSLNNLKGWYLKTDLNLILNLDGLTEKRLVNALDSIEKINLVGSQINLFKRVKNYLKLKPTGIIYDVTNTYFYGKKCAIAKFGHDKEGRKGYPLIQIGLAITQNEGIPILHKTLPGNIGDSRTFNDILTDLKTVNINEGVIVVDRGITSAKNAKEVIERGWKILFGVKIDKSIKNRLGLRFNSYQLKQPENIINMNKITFYCKEIEYKLGGIKGRLILIYNSKKAFKKSESRGNEIKEALIRLKNKKTIKSELRIFFDKKNQLIKSEIVKASQYDGMSFIFTTTDLTINDAIKAYFDKDVVEKCFQSLKGVVSLRPIRHWLYNRVEAHVFVCYLSCLLLSILKMQTADVSKSAPSILKELKGIYRVYIRDNKKNLSIGKLVVLTRYQEKLLRHIDKELLQDCSVHF